MAPSGAPKAKEAAKAKAAPGEGKAAKAKAAKKARVVEEEEGPKVEAPDWDAHNLELEKIQAAVTGLQEQQAALQEKITERSGGKEEYFKQREGFRVQLDAFQTKIQELLDKRESIQKNLGDKKTEGMEMKTKLNKMKRSIGYTSEADIDERIRFIEVQLMTETMPLKQEKDYMKEISELKRNRPQVGKIGAMEANLQDRDTGAGLKENIGVINEQLGQYFTAKKSVSEGLKALNEGRSDQMGDLPALIKQKEEFALKIREKQNERSKVRDEFREKEREFNQWKNDQRKARQAKVQEQWQAQEAERKMDRLKKKAGEMDQQPHVHEVTLIEQTIAFCKSLIAEKGTEKKEEAKEIDHGKLDGLELLTKKEEFYYAPTATKKKGKKKSSKEGSKSIKHNAETFKLFDQLKLNAPISTDDIPATLEQLEVQLEGFQGKIADWERHRDEMKEKILSGQVDEVEEVAKEEEVKEEVKEEEKEEDKKEEE